jgi:hypothetical protein
MRCSDIGLSTTTTSSGLFDDARTPATVLDGDAHAVDGDEIANLLPCRFFSRPWGLDSSPFFAASKCFTTSSTVPYLASAGVMRRHGRRGPGFLAARFSGWHRLARRAIDHLANCDRRDQAVTTAAAEQRIEEVTGLHETRQRSQLVGAALHVGMAGLPVGRWHPAFAEPGRSRTPGRLHVDHDVRILVDRRHVARQHHADLVGENLRAGIVDNAAAVAAAVETETDIGLVRRNARHAATRLGGATEGGGCLEVRAITGPSHVKKGLASGLCLT